MASPLFEGYLHLPTIAATPLIKSIIYKYKHAASPLFEGYLHFTSHCGHFSDKGYHFKYKHVVAPLIKGTIYRYKHAASPLFEGYLHCKRDLLMVCNWVAALLERKISISLISVATPLIKGISIFLWLQPPLLQRGLTISLEPRLLLSKGTYLHCSCFITQGWAADIGLFTVKGVMASRFLLV